MVVAGTLLLAATVTPSYGQPPIGDPVVKSGFLFNLDGEPIVGVEISLYNGETLVTSSTSNYRGSFSLTHPAAEGMLRLETATAPIYNQLIVNEVTARTDINLDTLRAPYGGVRAVMDVEGNEYRAVVIDDLVWMAENLRTTKYNNGDSIPWLPDPADWAATNTTSTGAFAIHSGDWPAPPDSVTSPKFLNRGALYNWYAVNDQRGICPTGMRIPSDDDWKALELFIGLPEGSLNAAGFPNRGNDLDISYKLQSTGDRFWEGPHEDATNETGFSMRSGSMRFQLGAYGAPAAFEALGRYATYWTSTENNATTAFRRMFHFTSAGINRVTTDKRQGTSIRCVRDYDPMTDVSVQPNEREIPSGVNLHQNYPNPFNPSTQIAFDLPQQANVRLAVYDLLGREIAVLVNDTRSAGSHQVTWTAQNLASGVYLYQLIVNGQSTSRRMLLMK